MGEVVEFPEPPHCGDVQVRRPDLVRVDQRERGRFMGEPAQGRARPAGLIAAPINREGSPGDARASH